MLRRFVLPLLGRKLVAELAGIRQALNQQTLILARLADRLAPEPVDDRDSVKHDTGVTHLDVNDALLAQAYIARTQRDTGHTPDDDEVLIYLADERTTDLHKRLIERDEQLARLAESRA